MKKLVSKIILLVLVSFAFVSCQKKEPVVYSGAVVLYTSANLDEVTEIKNGFEQKYPGIVLDYYYGNLSDLKTILNEELELDDPGVDVVYVTTGINNSIFSTDKLILPDVKKVSKDNKYVDKLALVSGSLNSENGKLLVEYLLSK